MSQTIGKSEARAAAIKLAVSVPEAAIALSIAPRTVRAWIAVGKLRSVHIGRRVVIRVMELERFLAAAEREQAGKLRGEAV